MKLDPCLTLYTQNRLDLNVTPEIVKPLKENTQKTLHKHNHTETYYLNKR